MLLKVFTALLLVVSSAQAANRPGKIPGERPSAKPAEVVSEKLNKLNETLAGEYSIQTRLAEPKNMDSKEAESFSVRVEELHKVINENSSKLSDPAFKLKLSGMMDSYNGALEARSTFKESAKAFKTGSPEASAAKEILELIDNGTRIMESKITESSDAMVSESMIMVTFNKIAEGVKSPTLSAKEVLETKKAVEQPMLNSH